MNDKQKEILIAWLNDAYGLEQSLIKNLEQQAKAAEKEGKTEIETKLREHLEQTKRHADLVEQCIEDLDGKVSLTKKVVGETSGFLQGVMKGMFDDGLVKSALESYAAENLEIASYQSIMAAAEKFGHEKTASVCADILADEEEMAAWLEEQIPLVTDEYLDSVK